MTPAPSHGGEPHVGAVADRLTRLRAGVLGANDGIVSTAGLVVGVAGATTDRWALVTAGIAGTVAGALSMAGGEYVSVSSQRDSERALVGLEQWELEHMPGPELDELTAIYEEKGLSPGLARQVAEELTTHDALAAHADVELHLDPDDLTSPWGAALTSLIAFAAGSVLPFAAIVLPPPSLRVPVCAVAVLVALVVTGTLAARAGRAEVRPAVLRNVGVGGLAMAVTYAVGLLVGIGGG